MADLTLRTVKGSPLTNQEVDDNFSNLNTDKYESGDSATFSDVTLTGMVGSVSWNSVDGTLDVPLNADVALQVGQEFVFYAKATEAIANGDAVMFDGAQGDHVLVKKCDMASVGFDPTYIVGVATQAFALNDFGYVTAIGKVRGLNTSAYAEGTILYVSPTVAGALTSTNPSGTGHVVQAAAVLRSHATEGVILVRLAHISELGELDGVAITSASTGQYLTYNGSSWVNTTLDTTNWDTAYSWGDHSVEGYLTSASLTGYATETYVNTQVTNLVDSAPTTLDTLNELAAALGDDPNFATTVSTSIGTKWTQDNTKISNWDTAYSWGDHASAGYLTSLALDGLSDVSAASPSDGQALVYNSTSGEWEASTPASTLGSLTDVSIAGVTDGQALVYNSTSGEWEAGASSSTTISATPPVDPSAGDLWWNSESGQLQIYYTDADGSQWVDAAAGASIATLGSLSDVSIAGVTDGQALVYNASSGDWEAGASSSTTVSTTAPVDPSAGDLWWNSESGQLKVYYTDGDSSQWVDAAASASTQVVTLSFPFYNSSTTLDSIGLVSNQDLPFFKADGTQDNITVTT